MPRRHAEQTLAPESPRTSEQRATGVLSERASIDLSSNGHAVRTVRVAAVIVTWNRRAMVDHVLHAIAAQSSGARAIDVVVVDNGSGDGTVEFLAERWSPERIVSNPTDRAEEPAFADEPGGARNAGGFGSLTIIRNAHNLGGCGGFNTGFGFLAERFDGDSAPDYVWLVDDDVDLPADALANLLATGESDAGVGLVGSRTKHIDDRDVTIESTIYFNHSTGCMDDHPTPDHPLHASHGEWAERTGGPKGEIDVSGERAVDVVSACSMLARWETVREVGFWDKRFFIYCDDADWCLRVARAGWRVVLNLDAVVYHTPWHHKLTPERHYYAQRNAAWMLHKAAPPPRLRRAMLGRLFRILGDAWVMGWRRCLFNAELIRRSAMDAAVGRAGRLEYDGPKPIPLVEAFERAGVLRDGARIAVLCRGGHFLPWAEELRKTIGASGKQIEWTEFVRNDAGDGDAAPDGTRRVIYSGRLRSKIRRQLGLLLRPPHAVIVFDTYNDLPLMRGRWNIHIDGRDRSVARVERDGFVPKLGFVARWAHAAARCTWFGLTVRPYRSGDRYG